MAYSQVHDRRNWLGHKRCCAFTLVELLIVVVILGILSTVVVPMFMDASEDAMYGVLNMNLRDIRQAMERYNIDHGKYPDWQGEVHGYSSNPMTQLTCKTDANGNVTTDGQFGPYIKGVSTGPGYDKVVLPPNPFVEKHKGPAWAGKVAEVNVSKSGDDRWENAPAGWMYDPATRSSASFEYWWPSGNVMESEGEGLAPPPAGLAD